jgi:hypothetical protein
MAASLKSYLADAAQRDQLERLETCAACGVSLQAVITGYRRINGIAHCSDCYFCKLSDVIDNHPIGRPMASLVRA